MSKVNERRKTIPHVYNLNFDAQLSGRIVQFVDEDRETVGNPKGDKTDIVLNGPRYVQGDI